MATNDAAAATAAGDQGPGPMNLSNMTWEDRIEFLTDKLSSVGKNITNQDGIQTAINCFRLLSEQTKSSIERTKYLLQHFSLDQMTDVISDSSHADLITSYQYLVQTTINTLTGVLEVKNQAKQDASRTLSVAEAISTKVPKKVDEERSRENGDLLYEMIIRLMRRASSFIISAQARDCLLALAMTNIDYLGLNFGVRLVDDDCLNNLLDIASEVEELKSESSMDVTPMTHSLVAAVLERIFSCHDHDKARETFREKVQEYVNKKLRNPSMEDKVRVAKIFTVLLAGPAPIGNSCVGQPGMIEMLLAMASSDEFAQQKNALDAIIAAASKKDKCASIATMGEKILNQLRESKNEDIRLRALVGLSKVASVNSTDASVRPFSREANPSFAKDCRSIISRPTPEFKLKQYAIEALVYLSFDGDVKEELVNDNLAMKALCETLTFDMHSPVVYSILNIFVNLTNSYDKQEQSPELLELAKFAKQHIPEEHLKDRREFLINRIKRLAATDLVSSLVQLHKVESKASKESLARIMNAMCEIEDIRGCLVQQGAVKLLMSLTQTESKVPEQSCIIACHALARLGITINPEFVYSGQRLIAAIRPLKRLLSPDCTALQNFEGLLALTNIAQSSDDARKHILSNNGFSLIEALIFEEHDLVKRAAVQCVVNLIRDPDLISLYEGENDRVKYLVILCQEEDLETIKAASGALAMLCQVSEKACERIFSAKQWCEILILLLSNENMELAHRAVVIVNCLVRCKNPKMAERVFESRLFEVLVALTLPEVTSVPEPIKSLASSCLKVGKQRELIRDVSALGHIGEASDEEE